MSSLSLPKVEGRPNRPFPSRQAVKVGSLTLGDGNPIRVQTMWKQPLDRFKKVDLERIQALQAMGCELLRFSVADFPAVEIVGRLAGAVKLPLVADIHFNHRLALACLDYPIAKIRINPGNIGASWKVKELLGKAASRVVPLRIGVNAASLPKQLRGEPDKARAMILAAEMELELLEKYRFRQAIFSLKSSDVSTTVRANLLFARHYGYPLHLGLTEAGPLVPGLVKSTLALSQLLQQGVGDTIRVSLSASAEEEVIAARAILRSSGARSVGANIISCPSCSRKSFDVQGFLQDVQDCLYALDKDLSIAIMGCPVNGPGEAREADLGITGTGKQVVLFRGGSILCRVSREEAVAAFKEELTKLCNDIT